ncbi:MAG: hypothetical protein ACTHJ4_06325 [Candidatus Nucleicultricaceae bacterium]
MTFANAEQLRRRLKEKAEAECAVKRSSQRFRVGDRVRIEKHKHVFVKGYLPRFTDEIFTVAEVRTARNPTTYKLRDDQGEMLTGWFYKYDLCLVLPFDKAESSNEKILMAMKHQYTK